MELLRRHYAEGKYQGSGKGLMIGVALLLLALGGALVWGAWKLGSILYQLLQQAF
ncbi:hypothetical protein [Hymenobacter sp. DG01]|uniref:hypothetical protein n=1 Tax=Hymenobacter sp. DG01 TaxID=2584940 RepID=UPI0015E03917|nr:hypothetical protein [Hymenobacter sp. DG01]